MLVTIVKSSLRTSWWGRSCVLGVVLLILSVLSVAPYLISATELVRVRNALVLVDNTNRPFDWTPAAVPSDFLLERGTVDPFFLEVAQRIGLNQMPSDWERILAISRHLLSNPKLVGTPIQSNLRDTYRRILEDGTGYCGDFTRVFMALAIAADVPVRAWAFSFDGFGGHGHIWPEVWNRQLKRWQLVDIFNNFYFKDASGDAVSALQFRDAMLKSPKSISRALLSPSARPGYEFEDKMWAWYRNGLHGWYMIWGNNVYSYDKVASVSVVAQLSRSLEQVGAIASGVYPPVILLASDENRENVKALWNVRNHLQIVGWAMFAAVLALVFGLLGWIVSRRNAKLSAPKFDGAGNASQS